LRTRPQHDEEFQLSARASSMAGSFFQFISFFLRSHDASQVVSGLRTGLSKPEEDFRWSPDQAFINSNSKSFASTWPPDPREYLIPCSSRGSGEPSPFSSLQSVSGVPSPVLYRLSGLDTDQRINGSRHRGGDVGRDFASSACARLDARGSGAVHTAITRRLTIQFEEDLDKSVSWYRRWRSRYNTSALASSSHKRPPRRPGFHTVEKDGPSAYRDLTKLAEYVTQTSVNTFGYIR